MKPLRDPSPDQPGAGGRSGRAGAADTADTAEAPRRRFKAALIGAAALVLAAVAVLLVRRDPGRADDAGRAPAPQVRPVPPPEIAALRPPPVPAGAHGARALGPAEKAARIAKIKQDYDEIRSKAAADYSAAGSSFPGGLNAFLRQLALLEREKHADFAAVLSPGELEDLEMRETTAGTLVQRLLGDTPATEDQRRAVFRTQRAFEERFALTFDLTPQALYEREVARHETQEKIRALLGDALFGEWLRGEGADHAKAVAFAAQQGLAPEAPLALWQAKNEFTRQRLALSAQKLPPEQLRAAHRALAIETEARVLAILGPGAMHAARRDVLSWLPAK